MNTKNMAVLALVASMMTAVGCASSSRTEIEYGKAVKQVTAAQVYDPSAAANPDPAAVLGGDPDRLNNSLEGYRKEGTSPSSVGDPITVNIGGGKN
ncbi:MAG: hypothetical protein KJO31_10740 [Gammaproteobacteria bacterium]|nr:hypothetical protein [Gammaproteobacteria bacterium]